MTFCRLSVQVFVFLAFFILYAVPVKAMEGDDHTRHFLWSVEKGKNTIYLLGSIHFLKKELYPLPEAIENIYDCCRKIVFETDLDSMSGPDTRRKLLTKGMWRTGQTLSQSVSPSTYDLLEKKIAGTGLFLRDVEKYKPWLAAQTVASYTLLGMGYDSALGIDRYFYDRAKKDGKVLLFLETNAYQINLFADLNRKKQEELLVQMLGELDIVEEFAEGMVSAWRRGDTGELETFFAKSYKDFPGLYKRFLTDRNRRWVSKINSYARQADDILIIVGAGHLVGRESVIELLRQKGYTVTQK